MMLMLDTTPRFFSPAEGERAAAELTEGEEDGWTYEIDRDPTGRSAYVRIRVTDEDGEFVAFFS